MELESYVQFSHGFRPLNCDEDVLKFATDVNGFELVDMYLQNTIDNPDVVDEADLGKDYDAELYVDDAYGPKSDEGDEIGSEAEVEYGNVDEGVQEVCGNVDEGVEKECVNVNDEVGDADYVASEDDMDNTSQGECDCMRIQLIWIGPYSYKVVKR